MSIIFIIFRAPPPEGGAFLSTTPEGGSGSSWLKHASKQRTPRGRVFQMDKAQAQSLTQAKSQAAPAWWYWGMVRARGVRTRRIGNRGRAEHKRKEDGDELKGSIKAVAISTSPSFA
jgi:hypothetical protein